MEINPTQLTDIELKQLQEFQQKSEVLTAQLGQLTLQKFQLEKNENVLRQKYDDLIKDELQISTSLKEKYGNVNIDIENGSITYS